MRKLIVSNIMSLDGYFEGPGGNVMALPMDGFFDEHNLERLRAADTLLLGATTYTGLKGYWPAVAADPRVSPAVAANLRWPTSTARPASVTTRSRRSRDGLALAQGLGHVEPMDHLGRHQLDPDRRADRHDP